MSAQLKDRKIQEFYLDEYIAKETSIRKKKVVAQVRSDMDSFQRLCADVKVAFQKEWNVGKNQTLKKTPDGLDDQDELLMIQKKAIIGHEAEVNFFKDKIQEYLKTNNLTHEWYPDWYTDLVSAIFHENWGFAGVDEWLRDVKSSSCKMIGEKIFFLKDGKQVLQKQKMSPDRIRQLISALMMNTPDKRMEDGYTEVYMLNGNRITIYDTEIGKEPYIIYRKYIVEEHSFEHLAERGTIPEASIPLWKAMIRMGFNVNFMGPVRSGKTTWLMTWQMLEDPNLEGIMVETDPEIPLHVIMPIAPIMQLVADNEKLRKIMKSLMRSDGDYLIMAEARDGVALKIAVQAGNKGTRRVKSTFHTSDPTDFPYDAANEIVQEFGGDVIANTIKVAKTFHYLFSFVQLKDKSKKRLKAVHELRYDPKNLRISTHQIMKYDFLKDSWTFRFDIGEDKRQIALEEDFDAYLEFEKTLKRLSEQFPMEGDNETVLPYIELLKK